MQEEHMSLVTRGYGEGFLQGVLGIWREICGHKNGMNVHCYGSPVMG
jgi:hypothetical protein